MKTLKNIAVPFLFSLIFICNNVFSQEYEGDGAEKGWWWYYSQRLYPNTTFPPGAFQNAVDQKNALISQNGYESPGGSSWNFLGPQPYDGGWTGTVSGRVKVVKFDPRDNNGNTFYVAGCHGGIWKTTDDGVTWQEKNGNSPNGKLPTLSTEAFDLDYQNGILYAGTGSDGFMGNTDGMGVYKSVDDGASWVKIWNDYGLPPNTMIYRILVVPNNPSTVYAAEWTGLFRTTNSGINWVKVLPLNGGNRICTDVAISPSGNNIYASGYSPQYWTEAWYGIGLMISHDAGVNWSQVDPLISGFPHYTGPPPLSNYQYGRTVLATSKIQNSENTVYVLTWDANTDANFVYRSTDAGVSFDLPYKDIYGNPIPEYNTGGNTDFNMLLKCSPYDANIVFAGFQDLLMTNNGGQIWYNKTTAHVDNHALDFCPISSYPNRVVDGCDGGVYLSQYLGDGWSQLNQNLGFAQFWDLCSNVYDVNTIIAGFEDQGVGYKNQNQGALNWTTSDISDRDGSLVLSSPFKSNYFLGSVGICYNQMYYSTNGGENFIVSNHCLHDNCYCSGCTTISNWIPVTANHPSQPGVSFTVRFEDQSVQTHSGYYTPIHVLVTTDYGANWNGNDPNHVQFNNPFYLVEPNQLAISQSNPNIMIMSLGNGSPFWQTTYNLYSRLIESTDGGSTWQTNPPLLVCDNTHGVPNAYLTHVEIDPVNANEIYITLSGYGDDHVFRTTNGGGNWENMNGSLPHAPTNDLFIHYTSTTTKEIVVAQDFGGVYASDAQNINWRTLSPGLPASPVDKLDHNRLSGKLNCATLGRGGWQYNMQGPIYVQDQLYITDAITLDKQIIISNGGKLIIGHESLPGFTINFTHPESEPAIIVEEGGSITANSGNQITFRSPSGKWGGIHFLYGSSGTLNNCNFQNSDVPVYINYAQPENSAFAPTGNITIENCNFTNGTARILGTTIIHAYLENCIFSGSNPTTQTAIELVDSRSVRVYGNTINNSQNGISESTGNSELSYNSIIANSISGTCGISIDNSESPSITYNTITGYTTGINLMNSSPYLLANTINTTTNGDIALYVGYNSNPILYPASSGDGTTIWNAGNNTLGYETNGNANSVVIAEGFPGLSGGYNHLNAGNYYITGDLSIVKYYVLNNCWNGQESDPRGKIYLPYVGHIYWYPASCTLPGASLFNEDTNGYRAGGFNDLQNPALEPPQPYIIDKGFGHYDTIKVTSGNLNMSLDEQMYAQCIKQELQNNYSGAYNTFQQLVQSYHDSITGVKALIALLPCVDKITNDTGRYTSLGNYYLSLIQSYPNDTILSKVANELSQKTLVRRGFYPPAITAYETDIQNTTDSLAILCYQLNIVETYMLIQNNGGNSLQFVGRYKDLKPANVQDGFRMIQDLLHHIKSHAKENVIPTVFKLSQNYPNPFNPSTKIDYQLPKSAKVVIKVYDILGKLVKELVNENKEAGFYTVTFDGTNFASGVYFYRINAGDFNAVKKMVLIK